MEARVSKVFSILFFLGVFHAYGLKNDPPAREISDKLEYFSSVVRPQKVYLHLDKTTYKAGQTIWFKAYLLDGISHIPDRGKTNLYVELINSDSKIMVMRLLLAEEGYSSGDIQLPPGLPDGNYVLRAYTNWMRNFGEESYFTRYLYIENSGYEDAIPRRDVLKNRLFNRRINRMSSNYEIVFFPEGGNLIAGTTNRVAFRVFDELGRGHNAEGEIVDRSGNIIAIIGTEFPGIGVFIIEPDFAESYKARVAVNGGRKRDYEFPQAREEGYALRLDNENGEVKIELTTTVRKGNPLYTERVILVGHTRGTPYFAETYPLQENRLEVTVGREHFPSGIAHFTVFTEGKIPVAERLVFIDRGDELSFSPGIGAVSEENGFFDFHLEVSDHEGNPVSGTFSLSAVAGHPEEGAQKTDILSYILFGSDLEGMVENPGAYLQSPDEAPVSADHLLLTYGWRRFNWDDVLAGELPEMRYSPQYGLTVAGKLTDPAKDQSLDNYPVRLIIRSGHDDLYETKTEKGIFAFPGLFYEGIVNMELSSRRLPGNYPPEINLNLHQDRELRYESGIYTREQNITARGGDWQRKRGASGSPYRVPERPVTRQLYGVPDQTIYIDYETSTERNISEVIRNRAVGVRFEGGEVIVRGPSSLTGQNEARFMIDGVFVNRNAFLNLYPRDVERIEIFRGTSAAIFGLRGGTGVLLAYTRRPGYHGFEDVLELSMLGYHETREFYSDYVSIPGAVIDETNERTIYWEPDLQSGKDGVINMRLPIHHGVDKLKFTVEGAGFDGGLGFTQFTLDIEE
jgi:hypothetical protein